ncbi:branched-chain alpha-ketoacid dehydrogenase [Hyaloraphidium curvatum]|nr:branched-chain alpha-ketoacid dehydrogenase [Hyaloraphidium curvatum]
MHPYFSSALDEYAKKEIAPITLKDLLRLGRGKEGLVESSKWLREELPKRLARRVRAIETLPFIVGLNPYIRNVYNLYRDSFDRILSFPPIETADDDASFTSMLTDLVGAHADVVPKLARGFLECDRYMTRPAIAAWLDRMIHARIGIRVLAEHHLALHHPMDGWIGIVNTKLDPLGLVRDVAHIVSDLAEANYGSSPDVVVEGPADTRFAYIPVHLEYMLTELVKNAARATIEHRRALRRRKGETLPVGASEEYPPVVVTVAPGPGVVTFRISDRGGGIPYDDVTKAFEYSYTTVSHEAAEESEGFDRGGMVLADVMRESMERGTGGPMAGLGFGLPMSNIYAKYFGGSLAIESMYGYGCDTYLTLRDIGDVSNLKIKD